MAQRFTLVGTLDLGLDPSNNDDYKFITLKLADEQSEKVCNSSHLVVYYNLGTNCWRDLINGMEYIELCYKFVCYWLAKQRLIEHTVILSFDMGDEALYSYEIFQMKQVGGSLGCITMTSTASLS